MISEVEVFKHVNDIMISIFIFFAKMVQDPYFNECLMMKSLFIPAKILKYFEHHFQDCNHLCYTPDLKFIFLIYFCVYILCLVIIQSIFLGQPSGGRVTVCQQTVRNISLVRKMSLVHFLIKTIKK